MSSSDLIREGNIKFEIDAKTQDEITIGIYYKNIDITMKFHRIELIIWNTNIKINDRICLIKDENPYLNIKASNFDMIIYVDIEYFDQLSSILADLIQKNSDLILKKKNIHKDYMFFNYDKINNC